jgi:acyl transferase domain-containing protein
LLLEESDAAVSAGVNLMLLEATTSAICQLQALSPGGRCKSFDMSADGYGRGEAISVLVLSGTNDMGIILGHGILRSSAINQVILLSIYKVVHKISSKAPKAY